MMRRKPARTLTAGFVVIIMGVCASLAMPAEALRMTKEDLKAMLGDPNVVILDVRVGSDWEGSQRKVSGAIRENPKDFESWANKYSKDKILVLYCA